MYQKVRNWCLKVSYEDSSEIGTNFEDEKLNVYISLKTIPTQVRQTLNAMGIMWFDIEKKERPLFWNELGDEVALFLRRYGVRFYRVEA